MGHGGELWQNVFHWRREWQIIQHSCLENPMKKQYKKHETTFLLLFFVTKLCPALCNPMEYSPPGSTVHGISQARILECVDIFFSRGSSWPRDWIHVSLLEGRFFTTESIYKPLQSSWAKSSIIGLGFFFNICINTWFPTLLSTLNIISLFHFCLSNGWKMFCIFLRVGEFLSQSFIGHVWFFFCDLPFHILCPLLY